MSGALAAPVGSKHLGNQERRHRKRLKAQALSIPGNPCCIITQTGDCKCLHSVQATLVQCGRYTAGMAKLCQWLWLAIFWTWPNE